MPEPGSGRGGGEGPGEDVLLARRMFLAGCLGLPWLWTVNAMYFRRRVFGPMAVLDYWPCGGTPPPPDTRAGGAGVGDIPNSNANGGEPSMEEQMERQRAQNELEKWVKRSTRGAIAAVVLFVSWIVTFQLNKEHFGPKWLVMEESDADVSGW